jgi:hypothetical protein
VCLRENIDLHVAVQPIARLVVYAHTQPGVADQRVEPVQLLCQRLGYLVHLLEIFEVALAPFDLACVAEFLQRVLGVVGVLFLVREEVDLGGVVLEEMGDDAVADACGTARYDIYLV